jgi:hypothetical protein
VIEEHLAQLDQQMADLLGHRPKLSTGSEGIRDSARSAATGSILVARLAGIHAAVRPTASSASVTRERDRIDRRHPEQELLRQSTV